MTMIKNRLYLALCGITFSFPLFAAQNIHYKGELIAGACELVVNGDLMATVDFNTLSNNDFDSNDQTAYVPFTLGLKHCSTALATGVLVTFSGEEESSFPGFLKPESSSTASGFAIGVETTDQRPLAINATQGTTFTLTEGLTTINLQAWLQKKTGEDIVPGEFTAIATVSFNYQ